MSTRREKFNGNAVQLLELSEWFLSFVYGTAHLFFAKFDAGEFHREVLNSHHADSLFVVLYKLLRSEDG